MSFDASNQNGFPPEPTELDMEDPYTDATTYAKLEDINKALAKIGIKVVFGVTSDGVLVAYRNNFKPLQF